MAIDTGFTAGCASGLDASRRSGILEGYEPVKRYEYLNTLLPGLRTVYLLHRQAASATP